MFYLQSDIYLNNKLSRQYSHLVVDSQSFDNFELVDAALFEESTFTNCIFTNCTFMLNAFIECSFVRCKFYNCSLNIDDSSPTNFVGCFSCEDNNGFLDNIESFADNNNNIEDHTINLEQTILERFFNQGSLRPRYRQVSQLNADIEELNTRELAKQLHILEVSGYLVTDGNLCHLTKEGIMYYNDTYRK